MEINKARLILLRHIYIHPHITLEQLENHFDDGGIIFELEEFVKAGYIRCQDLKFNLDGNTLHYQVDADFSKLPYSVSKKATFMSLAKADVLVEEQRRQRREEIKSWVQWILPTVISIIALVVSIVALAGQSRLPPAP